MRQHVRGVPRRAGPGAISGCLGRLGAVIRRTDLRRESPLVAWAECLVPCPYRERGFQIVSTCTCREAGNSRPQCQYGTSNRDQTEFTDGPCGRASRSHGSGLCGHPVRLRRAEGHHSTDNQPRCISSGPSDAGIAWRVHAFPVARIDQAVDPAPLRWNGTRHLCNAAFNRDHQRCWRHNRLDFDGRGLCGDMPRQLPQD